MSAEILLTVVVTAVIQSVFGAGVLLFGTPILLLLGYPFVEVLVVLLPISIAINLLQVAQHRCQIDPGFYRSVLILTLPPIALFLFLVTHVRLNVGALVGVVLLLISAKEVSPALSRLVDRCMAFERTYFVLMGVVHGLSNLGGSLLTALVHHRGFPKDTARVTVAACYATFAVVQLATLALFSDSAIEVAYHDNGIYLVVGALVFLLTDAMLYAHLDPGRYRIIFAGFLLLSGVLLIGRSLA